ncbi:MAG: WD40 repeat domain-containing protein [Pirellulales bacterium]
MPFQPDQLRLVAAHQSPRQLLACCFSAEPQRLYSAGMDGQLSQWNLESGEQTAFPAHQGWIERLRMSPDRQRLYSADSWGQIRAWNTADQPPSALWKVENACGSWLRDMAISPDGSRLATCGNEPVVRVYAAADGQLLQELRGHEPPVYSVAFRDQETLVSGDLHGNVKHWNIAEGREARQLNAPRLFKIYEHYRQGGVRAMAFDTQGQTLYCGGIEGTNANQSQGQPTIVALDWESGQEQLVMTPAEAFNGPIMDIAFHPAGFVVGTGSSEGGGMIWCWLPGQAQSVFKLQHATSFRQMDISADGARLAAAAFGDLGGQRGGNGRRLNDQGDYPCFGGNLVLCTWDAPAAAP